MNTEKEKRYRKRMGEVIFLHTTSHKFLFSFSHVPFNYSLWLSNEGLHNCNEKDFMHLK